jgi:hypothetical protein
MTTKRSILLSAPRSPHNHLNIPLLLLVGLFLGTLVSCNFPERQALPTPLPPDYVSTAIALTVEAQGVGSFVTAKPLVSPSPQNDGEKPQDTSPAPEFTPTPTASPVTSEPIPPVETSPPPPNPDIPFGTIQILSPGPASRLASPFLFKAYLLPGEKSRVHIELLGEDGRLLMREIKVYSVPHGARVTVGSEVAFEISAVAETGRVQASVEDEYGRTAALTSVDVILLSLGESDLNPPGDLLEDIVIKEPHPSALIQGGTLRVSGLARVHGDQPLMIELQTSEGKTVGTRQAAVLPSEEGQFGDFAIDVPFNVTAPTWARLAVWEPGSPIPGIVHLSSLEVMLSP